LKPGRFASDPKDKSAGSARRLFIYASSGTQLSLNRWEIYKSLFESRDGAQKIVPARDQRPGEESDSPTRERSNIAGLFLFSGDVAIEDSGRRD
jgi:hypothetical protein